jgi:hypothetical protein
MINMTDPSARPSWETLVELEPRLLDLEGACRRARCIRDVPDPSDCWCALDYWLAPAGTIGLKQIMGQLVGWGRDPFREDPERPEPERFPLRNLDEIRDGIKQEPGGLFTLDELATRRLERRRAEAATGLPSERRRVLHTSEAYDAAYGHLFELLPTCTRIEEEP